MHTHFSVSTPEISFKLEIICESTLSMYTSISRSIDFHVVIVGQVGGTDQRAINSLPARLSLPSTRSTSRSDWLRRGPARSRGAGMPECSGSARRDSGRARRRHAVIPTPSRHETLRQCFARVENASRCEFECEMFCANAPLTSSSTSDASSRE